MRHFSHVFVATFTVLTIANSLMAAVHSVNQFEIDLTDSESTHEKATWSEPDKIRVTSAGLGWEGAANSSRDFWLQTRPIAIGLSYRPPSSASVMVTISPEARSFKLPNGQSSHERVGAVYVRHSPDKKHWSDWQHVDFSRKSHAQSVKRQQKGVSPFLRSYQTSIRIPQKVREQYSKRLTQFMRSDAEWKNDEEALVKELIAEDPDYFAKQQPFIGYIQFLYETSLHGGLRLERFTVDVGWVVSGMMLPSSQPTKDREVPWRYVAEPQEQAD